MTSLFQLRSLWEHHIENEISSDAILILHDIPNYSNTAGVLIGTFSGLLRFFIPQFSSQKGRQEDDQIILCEVSFPDPILQLNSGWFMDLESPHENETACQKKTQIPSTFSSLSQIVILYPFQFSVVSFLFNGSDFSGSLHNEKNQERTAGNYPFNIVTHYCVNIDSPSCQLTVCHFSSEISDNELHDYEHSTSSSLNLIAISTLDMKILWYHSRLCIFTQTLFTELGSVPGICCSLPWRGGLFVCALSKIISAFPYPVVDEFIPMAKNLSKKNVSDNNKYLSESAWRYLVSEEIIDLQCHGGFRQANSPREHDDVSHAGVATCPPIPYLFALCHQSILIFHPSGYLYWQWHTEVSLNYFSCSCLPNQCGNSPIRNISHILVGANDFTLTVLAEKEVTWRASVPFSEEKFIFLTTGSFQAIQGMLVFLTNKATLSIQYLGTTPSTESLNPIKNYLASSVSDSHDSCQSTEKINTCESRCDLKVKEKSDSICFPCEQNIMIINKTANFEYLFCPNSTSISQDISLSVAVHQIEVSSNSPTQIPTCVLDLEWQNIHSTHLIHQMTLIYHIKTPLKVESPNYFIDKLLPGNSSRHRVNFMAYDEETKAITPSSLVVEVTVQYRLEKKSSSTESESDLALCIATSQLIHLPLSLVATAIQEKADNRCQVQLNSLKCEVSPSLITIFPEVPPSDYIKHNAMSLKYANDTMLTVLVSSRGANFRFLASCLGDLTLLIDEHIARMGYFGPSFKASIYSKSDTQRGSNSSFSNPPKSSANCWEIPRSSFPIEAYLSEIQRYFQIRQEVNAASNNIQQIHSQLRSFHTFFTSYTKSHNPLAFESMETPLRLLLKNLGLSTNALKKKMMYLKEISAILSSSNACISLLLANSCPQFKSVEEARRLIEIILPLEVLSHSGTDWEERVMQALAHFFSKNSKNTSSQSLSTKDFNDISGLVSKDKAESLINKPPIKQIDATDNLGNSRAMSLPTVSTNPTVVEAAKSIKLVQDISKLLTCVDLFIQKILDGAIIIF